jgi:hypothetical protein
VRQGDSGLASKAVPSGAAAARDCAVAQNPSRRISQAGHGQVEEEVTLYFSCYSLGLC